MSRNHNILYRCYDEYGRCLYIGQTMQPVTRFRKHTESKFWWSGVASIGLEHHRTQDALERAERKAIAVECPIYNVHHNPRRRELPLDYYDDGDPDDEPEDGEWVLEEYDGPEVDCTGDIVSEVMDQVFGFLNKPGAA